MQALERWRSAATRRWQGSTRWACPRGPQQCYSGLCSWHTSRPLWPSPPTAPRSPPRPCPLGRDLNRRQHEEHARLVHLTHQRSQDGARCHDARPGGEHVQNGGTPVTFLAGGWVWLVSRYSHERQVGEVASQRTADSRGKGGEWTLVWWQRRGSKGGWAISLLGHLLQGVVQLGRRSACCALGACAGPAGERAGERPARPAGPSHVRA